jgi:hypothetical protein
MTPLFPFWLAAAGLCRLLVGSRKSDGWFPRY